MRILVYEPVDPAPDPPPFGESQLSVAVEAALGVRGHEVTRVPSRRRASLDPDHAQRKDGDAERLVAADESGSRPDLWLSCRVSNQSVDDVGPAACAALGIPYVLVQPRVGDDADGESGAQSPIREACGRADAIIVFSSGRAGSIARCLVDRPERLITLSPFVDMRRVAAAARNRSHHRAASSAKLRLSQDRPWIISAGPMTGDRSLAAFQTVARSMSSLVNLDWNLVVGGSGPHWDDVEAMFRHLPRERYRQVAVTNADELLLLLLTGDLFLWPAPDEDYAITALEAQAAGLGVVAAKSSGMLDVVADGQTGMLVKTDNVPSITNAVNFLLRHPDFRRSYAKRGPELVAMNFGLPAVARELDATLRRIHEQHKAGGQKPPA